MLFTYRVHPRNYGDYAVFGSHDGVIKWQQFPRYWPDVLAIQRSPLNSPPKGQWREALIFFFIYAWTNGEANNRDAGDLRLHRLIMTSM